MAKKAKKKGTGATGKISKIRKTLQDKADAYGIAAAAVEMDSELKYRVLDAKQLATLNAIAIIDSEMKG